MTNEQATHTGGGLFKELVIMFGLIGLLVTLLTGVGALYWMQSVPGPASAGTPGCPGCSKPSGSSTPGLPTRSGPWRWPRNNYDPAGAEIEASASRARLRAWLCSTTGTG